MASGHRHWTVRLQTLSRQSSLSRSQRRQLRKLLGRRMGKEWRLMGLQTRGSRKDPLNDRMVIRARTVGHIVGDLRETS